ncbi:hypothetical protein Sipo8835_12535 [Streptomyces ipomoeae]|jgi:hypothetical protein|uniref:Uncharacterized protein n=2 Tax=Streptomyces ipomoeae TaxID=103232 RepID=L1KUD8_9ACTN|nr:hypothetical protein [Streptomyces ipomoeae]EKX64411.1 hypothetical protein STRIP9103_00576 [Streptomyces ipomoeae 91-03]MDX2698925.1 hypothetical protein [Streptomyces ipomoeae]MDX2826472.1 hypothetical protein [Streptomyces ipomoeae]MDX2843430.1 hypothetical protein [Streptomyces ipomoeae]MDX2879150.1 hypothetical protein [Streptomyces ipomoeae]
MFDLRAEAEMRLHSDRTAREIAVKKRHDEDGESGVAVQEPSRDDEGHELHGEDPALLQQL